VTELERYMKKTLNLLLILFILLGLYFLFKKGQKDGQAGSIKLEDREFVVKDRSDINVITIKPKGYPLNHLSKSGDKWIYNNKYEADMSIVRNMLNVLTKMRINYIPPQNTLPKIYNGFKEVGIDINVYDKAGNVLSSFILGGNTVKEDATYCMRQGYKQPYAMCMPTTVGGLRAYFNQTAEQLRSKIVFDLEDKKVESVELLYNKDRKNSFSVSQKGGEFVLDAPNYLKNRDKQPNPKMMSAYLKDFDRVGAEAIKTGMPSVDSLRQYTPFANMTINVKNAAPLKLVFYPNQDVLNPKHSTVKAEDVFKEDRHFVFDDTNGEVYIVQQRLLNDIFRTPDYFYR